MICCVSLTCVYVHINSRVCASAEMITKHPPKDNTPYGPFWFYSKLPLHRVSQVQDSLFSKTARNEVSLILFCPTAVSCSEWFCKSLGVFPNLCIVIEYMLE